MRVATRRLYAKGRLKSGEMNATESAYAAFPKGKRQGCGWNIEEF